MPFSNVSKLPDPLRAPSGMQPPLRAPQVPTGPLPPEVPNLRDFRSPAEEFARRARVPALPADAGARLRSMAPPDMSGVAERLAPKAATAGGFGLGEFVRGAARLAGPVAAGAELMLHSGSLNSGEDAELARLRSQSPTIDPPESPMMGYANGGMISGAEELEELRRDARAAQLLRETAPDMSEVEKRLGAPNGDRLRAGPGPQQFSTEDKIRLNPANAGPQRSLGGMPPPESVPSNTGRYAYSPATEGTARAVAPRAATAAGFGMGAGAAALAAGGAAATGLAAGTVANNPEYFQGWGDDAGLASNIILASREGQAQREAAANGKPTPQQIERAVSGPTPQPGAQQIERMAGFWQEPAAQRPAPFAAARPRPGRAAPGGAPGGMLPQAEPRDEAGFERLISDAQAGRAISTPRQRLGATDFDAQSEAINAEGRADLGPGGYIMANGTPYIDLAKGNADPEWRKRFDDRQARQNAISEQRPDRDQMPVVIKDGNAYIGNAYAAPADIYWRGESKGGLGRQAIEAFQGQLQKVQNTQFDEAINPGERESRQKMAQLGVTAQSHVDAAREQAGGHVLGALAQAQAAQAGNRQKMTTQQMEKTIEMRKEYEGLPEVKGYKQMVPVYRTMLDAAKRDTPMADINLVYGLAKLFDPTSVVREGEYATVAKSPAIPEWVKGQANHLLGGGKLTTETRRQMLAEAQSRMKMAEGELGRVRTQYDRIATDTGLDPTLITLQSFQTDGGAGAGQRKTKVVGNTTYVFDGRGWVQQGEN